MSKSYDEFRREYEMRHPASVPKKRLEASPFPWWVKWVALFMFACSALLSGVHTVPVVRDGIPPDVVDWLASLAAGSAFISIELAIFVSTFALVGGGSPTVWGVLLLSSVTALGANIYAVIQAYIDAISTRNQLAWGTLLVAVLIGIVAPGVAYLSGRLYVNLSRVNRKLTNDADARLLDENQKWDDKILAAFLEYEQRVQASVQNAVQNGQQSTSSVQASSKVEKHYTDHPADLDKQSIRDVAAMLDVSKSTVANVRSKMLSNGHGTGAENDTD